MKSFRMGVIGAILGVPIAAVVAPLTIAWLVAKYTRRSA